MSSSLLNSKLAWTVSVEQRVFIITFYFQNQCSVRGYVIFYLRHNRPAESTTRRLVAKFKSTGLINHQPTPIRHQNAVHCVRLKAINFSSFARTWSFNDIYLANFALKLGFASIKIQLTQELKVNDHIQHRVFVDLALGQLEIYPNFVKKNHL